MTDFSLDHIEAEQHRRRLEQAAVPLLAAAVVSDRRNAEEYGAALRQSIDALLGESGVALTEADALADLNGTPRPDHPTI